METVIVESHAGSRPEEYPRRFSIHGRQVEIISIIKRWLTPGHRCFKVLGNDGYEYSLEYNSSDDTWYLLTQNRP